VSIPDQDRFFSGQLSASTPKHLIGEGELIRLVNARFMEGAISNGVGFDELPVLFDAPKGQTIFASRVTYDQLLQFGDVQLFAPLENLYGKYLVVVISGRLFQIDLSTNLASEITPQDSYLPERSSIYPLSYLDNGGGVYGVGGYLVIFNGYNRPIFVEPEGARLSLEGLFEMPPSWMGATAGTRAFVIAYPNTMYASDPLGGASGLAPLTFEETLDPLGSFYGQVFTIGSALQVDPVTAVCRLPQYLAPTEEFLARSLLISTAKQKFIVAAGSARLSWDSSTFISYAGSTDGVAGPLACTNIGDVLFYVSTTGRYKTIGQDAERERGLTETFMDEPLGQYVCLCEANYMYRDWYRTLDHSRAVAKFSLDRVYVTAYPVLAPAVSAYGEKFLSPSFRALAVASIDPSTRLGPTATLAWEGFYDWLNPIGLATVGEDFYVVTKDQYGRIRYYRENFIKVDEHESTIYTRGYFSAVPGKAKSMLTAELYFRKLAGPVRIRISYLSDDKWICGSDCVVKDKLHRASFRETKCKSASWAIPLKIDIDHKGCRFELESIRVDGEAHRDQR